MTTEHTMIVPSTETESWRPQFGDGRDVGSELARSLVTQDMVFHEEGIQRSYRDIISAWPVTGTM